MKDNGMAPDTMHAFKKGFGSAFLGSLVWTARRLGFDYCLHEHTKSRWKPVAAKRIGVFMKRIHYVRRQYPGLKLNGLFSAGLLPGA